MHLHLRDLPLLGLFATLTGIPLWGQMPAPRQEVDLAVTYLAQRSNITPGQSFWLRGADFELSTKGPHGLGIAMNIAGSEATNIRDSGINLDTLTTTFGPRYTWDHRKIAIFGQGSSVNPMAGIAFSPSPKGPQQPSIPLRSR